VSDERRNKRLRLLINRLNKERKKQAKQIDILCNDFVAAQKDFIKSLNTIGFAADFYEAIAGLTELNELLCTAGNLIKDQIPDANVAFSLLANNNFELHIFESDQPINLEDKRIENFFTTELVNEIAKSNRICTIDDMLAMGLAGNPRCIEKVTAVGSLGFVLVYRSSQKPLDNDELKCITQIAPGLSRAIAACRVLANIA
jgi:hypothetical protein